MPVPSSSISNRVSLRSSSLCAFADVQFMKLWLQCGLSNLGRHFNALELRDLHFSGGSLTVQDRPTSFFSETYDASLFLQLFLRYMYSIQLPYGSMMTRPDLQDIYAATSRFASLLFISVRGYVSRGLPQIQSIPAAPQLPAECKTKSTTLIYTMETAALP